MNILQRFATLVVVGLLAALLAGCGLTPEQISAVGNAARPVSMCFAVGYGDVKTTTSILSEGAPSCVEGSKP